MVITKKSPLSILNHFQTFHSIIDIYRYIYRYVDIYVYMYIYIYIDR